MKYEIRIMLDEVLASKNKTRYWLAKKINIPFQTIDRYYKNSIRRYEADTILKMCIALDCQVGDLIKIIKK